MGKETLLPKNIRQIGDIQGRQKICLEDYVMTYIRKKEQQEGDGFLGVFLGERRQTEENDYVFIRGILKVPDPETLPEMLPASVTGDANRAEAKEQAGAGCENLQNTGVSAAGTERGKQRDTGKTAADAGREKRRDALSEADEEPEKMPGKAGGHTEAAGTGSMQNSPDSGKKQDLREYLRQQQEMHFPGWEFQGCCVIGTYPSGRMKQLLSCVPDAERLLYHLQDQEERLYLMKEGKYEGLRGYLVFYEQNRRMQEYMEEAFGEQSVEKEGLPDRAIRSFREKIREKSEEKSRSFLKLAGSFFVVTLLIIGAVVVNRLDSVRQVRVPSEEAGERTEPVIVTTAASDAAEGAAGSSKLPEDASGLIVQQADDAWGELAGSDVFWSDDSAEMQDASAAVSATDNASGAESAQSTSAASAADDASGAESAQSASASALAADNASGAESAQSTSAASAADNASGAESAQSTSAASAADDASGAESAQSTSAASVTGNASGAESAQSTSAASATDNISGTENVPGASADGAGSSGTDLAASSASGTAGTDTQGVLAEASSRQVYAAYVIRQGDTLADICSRYYGSLDRLEDLCEINGIQDADLILPGQKLVLP